MQAAQPLRSRKLVWGLALKKAIQIRGARTHNLRDISLSIPRDKLVVITGLSGSGKSSLAFDTLYAEGQRRYVESLSTYARQFLSVMEKPDVDSIEGLSPAISIEQKSTSHNPRSTVGTVTEIYDYLRLLYARVGDPVCPEHGKPLAAQTVSEMVDQVLAEPKGSAVQILAPFVRDRKGEHSHSISRLRAQGFVRVRVDGVVLDLDEFPALDKNKKHSIDVVVDRLRVRKDVKQRLAESLETALGLSGGLAIMVRAGNGDDAPLERLFSSRFACPVCDYSLDEMEPRLFSFNSPAGACPDCDGLGVVERPAEERVVLFPDSSIAHGAIRGWDRNNRFYYEMLEALAAHYGFSLDAPFGKLAKKHRHVILEGSGKQNIKFVGNGPDGRQYHREHPFEGVLPNLVRRYKDSDSTSLREELGKYMAMSPCNICEGSRLRREARHVFVDGRSLPEISRLNIADAVAYFDALQIEGARGHIADKVLGEIRSRLHFLADVGLGYLSLERSAETLSGGEAQRIRLASQIGAGLVGVMYVLDEPSIGLHQRDNARLLSTLTRLRDLGNTVVVVEHDEEAMDCADHIIDIGPGAGVHGGRVVAQGKMARIAASKGSITGDYLAGRRRIEVPERRKRRNRNAVLRLLGASGNNLRDVNLEIPLGLFTCVTGVSGSGKSTLINSTLYPLASTELNHATTLSAAAHLDIEGLEQLSNCIDINQAPIGRTPRSNPATYTGLFTSIRDLFTATQEARARGYKAGRFSFNVPGGRCEACQGDGLIRVEMHFLPDVYVTCEQCSGRRYNRETLEIFYKGKNISDVLGMTVTEALGFFEALPAIHRKLQHLDDVGLGYISLGQPATTLSGGEAQRIKLARELSRRDTGSTLYLLDEPTTGLHFYDIDRLLRVLHRLRDAGNTIVVIEHNLDVIKTADWVVDMGPEGGSGGGRIIATGTPEQLAKKPKSFTGQFLQKVLESRR